MSSTPKNNKPVRRIDISRLVELGQPLHIISLGSRCYTRTFPERFHLYNFKQNQSRMPFDGCLTTYKALCNLINTDLCAASYFTQSYFENYSVLLIILIKFRITIIIHSIINYGVIAREYIFVLKINIPHHLFV
jgi:hypothetical protein